MRRTVHRAGPAAEHGGRERRDVDPPKPGGGRPQRHHHRGPHHGRVRHGHRVPDRVTARRPRPTDGTGPLARACRPVRRGGQIHCVQPVPHAREQRRQRLPAVRRGVGVGDPLRDARDLVQRPAPPLPEVPVRQPRVDGRGEPERRGRLHGGPRGRTHRPGDSSQPRRRRGGGRPRGSRPSSPANTARVVAAVDAWATRVRRAFTRPTLDTVVSPENVTRRQPVDHGGSRRLRSCAMSRPAESDHSLAVCADGDAAA